jgi:hypothetical protein
METSMKPIRHARFAGAAVAAVFLVDRSLRIRRGRPAAFRQSVADGRQRDFAEANAAADQAAYQEVEYVNKGTKGPALVVIPVK